MINHTINRTIFRFLPSKAEGERFELSMGFPKHAFQACALGHYANPPIIFQIFKPRRALILSSIGG